MRDLQIEGGQEGSRGNSGLSGPDLRPLGARNLIDFITEAVRQVPRQIAVAFPSRDTRFTFEELAEASRSVAAGLRDIGVDPGDRVGIMLANGPEHLLAWLGSLITGSVSVAINHGLAGDLLAHQLQLTRPKVIVTDESGLRAVRREVESCPSVQALVVVGNKLRMRSPVRLIRFEALLNSSSAAPTCAPEPDSVAIVRMTSGTTGPAKGVAMTHSQLMMMARHFEWLAQLDSTDRLYTCFPMHHGLATVGILASLGAGASCIVDERFSASRYWERIRFHGATIAHILAPLVAILLSTPRSDLDRQHRCTRLWTAPHNAEFEGRFNTRLITHYSMSEGNVIAFEPPGERAPQGSSGKVNPLFELRIASATGDPLDAGEEGEILWRPRRPGLMMAGYEGAPEATVAAWRDLWFHSGDRGHLDRHGYLFLAGRQGDQIRRKGVNISASDVERAALTIPSIREAVAIAVPSELGESEIKLCLVVSGRRPSVAAVVKSLKGQLPNEMVPRYLEFRYELPRTDTHKVARGVLRAEGTNGITDTTIDLEPDGRRRPL